MVINTKQKLRQHANTHMLFLLPISRVRRRSRRTFSTHFEIFRRRSDGVVIYFSIPTSIFLTTRRNFQLPGTSLVVFFLFKVHVSFSSSQVFIGTMAIVTSYRSYKAQKYDSDEIISRPLCRNALLTHQFL